MELKEKFLTQWKKYFNGADLPITFYYKKGADEDEIVQPNKGRSCIICELQKVRQGTTLCFNVDSIGCPGGKRYLGFTDKIMPNFEYFLSCGIPGKLEGERYKKTPDIVKEMMKMAPVFKAPSDYIVFKRWDKLEESDNPEVVIFFSQPDVLSGLFTLINFDTVQPMGVIAPFSAGCGSIVHYPYLEKDAEQPKGVLGMFDVSARPCVPDKALTLSVPIEKFSGMIGDMEESFLITSSWQKVKKRIKKAH